MKAIALCVIITVLSGCKKTEDTTVAPTSTAAARGVPQPIAAKPVPKPTFTISGLKFGDVLTDDYRSHHPFAKDLTDNGGKPYTVGNDTIDVDGKSVAIQYVFKNNKRREGDNTFEGQGVTQLIGVILSFDASLFPTMIQTYTEKLGPPSSRTTQPFTTKGGATFANEIVSWETNAGTFVLRKYGDSLEAGGGELRSPELMKYSRDMQDARTAEMKQRL